MDRPVVLETVRFLHQDMKEKTLWAGISEKRYDRLLKNVDLYTDEELIDVYDWLLNIWDCQYKELIQVYNMVPDQNWENYVLLGISDLQEQVLMDKAKKALYDRWKSAYYPKRKIIRKVVRHVKEKAAESNSPTECPSGSSV